MAPPKKAPSLHLNKQGFYEIRWSENGRSKRRSTRTSDFGFAQKILANFILIQGDEPPAPSLDKIILIDDIFGEPYGEYSSSYWHDHILLNAAAPEIAYYSIVKLKKHFGHLSPSEIEASHVNSYIEKRKRGTIGNPSCGATISRELSVLNAAINHAAANNIISPADRPIIKRPPQSKPKDRWLTKKEALRLLEAARGKNAKLPRVYRFIALGLLGTASRKTAIFQLQRRQVDMENGLIHLNPPERTQTNKRRAIVPISNELRPILAQILNQIPDEPSAYLMDHPGDIRKAFSGAVKRAGLGSDVTPHTLRHTWATWAAQAGVSMFDIAGVLGDRVETVTKNYAHHCPNYLRNAVNHEGVSLGILRRHDAQLGTLDEQHSIQLNNRIKHR